MVAKEIENETNFQIYYSDGEERKEDDQVPEPTADELEMADEKKKIPSIALGLPTIPTGLRYTKTFTYNQQDFDFTLCKCSSFSCFILFVQIPSCYKLSFCVPEWVIKGWMCNMALDPKNQLMAVSETLYLEAVWKQL